MKHTILTFIVSILLAGQALACDSGFIPEPTTAPVSVTEDMWIGFEYRTYEFPDGRELVAIRQFLDIMGTETVPNPSFYIAVSADGHTSVTYIDPVGDAQCVDIQRY